LAQNQYSLNAKNKEGYTALHLAIRLGFEEMVIVLLDAGADTDILANDDNTPVMLAVRYIYPRILDRLLCYGANANGRVGNYDDGVSPLHVAAAGSNDECMRILLQHRPLIDIKYEGRTPLVEACR
jgi:ankyrin repeat protein